MRRATFFLLAAFAFAVPWEYSLDLGSSLGNVARVVSVLALLAAIPAVLLEGGMRRPGWLQWLVLALYLYYCCTYFWTVDADATLEKIRSYAQVMMTVWLVWEFAETPADLRWLIRALVAGCWVLALLTAADYARLGMHPDQALSDLSREQSRFVAAGQDPNDVARFLDLGLPFAAWLLVSEKRLGARLLGLGYLPAGFGAILLTASRGGFSAALIALAGAVALVLAARAARFAQTLPALAGLAAAAIGAFFLVPRQSLQRLSTTLDEVHSGDLNQRLNIWVAGWDAFRHRPWFGSGAGSYVTAAGLSQGDTAHNTALAILVTGGLVGFSLCAAILAAALLAMGSTKGLLRLALATLMTVWIVTAMVGSVEENRMTWLVFAIVALAGRLARRPWSCAPAMEQDSHVAGLARN